MQILALKHNIVHIVLPDQKELATALMRFQEYYESPLPDIKGQIFTVGYLKSKGSRASPGIHTYEGGNHFAADWAGYNFPSCALEPFVRGLFDPLTSYEQDIVNALKSRQDKFYVIGTSPDYMQALDHEIAHALYYTDDKYKLAVHKILRLLDLRPLKKVLRAVGYCEEVLDDECHAYISADYEDLESKWKVKLPRSAHNKLKQLRLKHYEG